MRNADPSFRFKIGFLIQIWKVLMKISVLIIGLLTMSSTVFAADILSFNCSGFLGTGIAGLGDRYKIQQVNVGASFDNALEITFADAFKETKIIKISKQSTEAIGGNLVSIAEALAQDKAKLRVSCDGGDRKTVN